MGMQQLSWLLEQTKYEYAMNPSEHGTTNPPKPVPCNKQPFLFNDPLESSPAVSSAVVLDLELKNHSGTRQLICYSPPWALLETDFTGKRATENVSRQRVCAPETPSSCDFKSILFPPHLKSFTLAGRHFDAFKNKTRERFEKPNVFEKDGR